VSARAELERALADAGFSLRVGGKHMVWRHPSGARLTMSSTPGDRRAYLNQRSDVRRALRAVGAAVNV
jgi:hypothetical protein